MQSAQGEREFALLPGLGLERLFLRRVAHLEHAQPMALGRAGGELQRRLAHIRAIKRDPGTGRLRAHAHQAIGALQRDWRQGALLAGANTEDVLPRLVAGQAHGNASLAGQHRHRARGQGVHRLVVHRDRSAGRRGGNGHIGPVRRQRDGNRLLALHAYNVELHGGRLVAAAGDGGNLPPGRQADGERRRAAGLDTPNLHQRCRRIHLKGDDPGQPRELKRDGLVARRADGDALFQRMVARRRRSHRVASGAQQMRLREPDREAAVHRHLRRWRIGLEANGFGGEQEPQEPSHRQGDAHAGRGGDAARGKKAPTLAALGGGGLEAHRLNGLAARRRRRLAHLRGRAVRSSRARVKCVPCSGCPPGPCPPPA